MGLPVVWHGRPSGLMRQGLPDGDEPPTRPARPAPETDAGPPRPPRARPDRLQKTLMKHHLVSSRGLPLLSSSSIRIAGPAGPGPGQDDRDEERTLELPRTPAGDAFRDRRLQRPGPGSARRRVDLGEGQQGRRNAGDRAGEGGPAATQLIGASPSTSTHRPSPGRAPTVRARTPRRVDRGPRAAGNRSHAIIIIIFLFFPNRGDHPTPPRLPRRADRPGRPMGVERCDVRDSP
jgi:hypothetical protein